MSFPLAPTVVPPISVNNLGAGPDVPENPYKCHICRKDFTTKWKRKRHFESVHVKSKQECPVCKHLFNDLKKHQRRTDACGDNRVRVRCEICEKDLHGDITRHRMGKKHLQRMHQTQ